MELTAVVYPKQKKVLIKECGVTLKVYRFKMDIPFKIVERLVLGYDYGEFCASERDYHKMVPDKEWDSATIEKIKQDAIKYYLETGGDVTPITL